MVKALFDTNVLIDYLQGSDPARSEIQRYEQAAISIVTWMEVMVGAGEQETAPIRAFLSRFDLVELDEAVAEEAISLRRLHRMRLPDAIVWASARTRHMLLVTRDKGFPADDPGVRRPY
jgi:predicted nucleic acid-binding protein